MKYTFALLILLLYIVFGPLLLIWSLNTLFMLNILYTFNNWLAVYVLMSTLSITFGGFQKTSKDKYVNEKVDKETTNTDS